MRQSKQQLDALDHSFNSWFIPSPALPKHFACLLTANMALRHLETAPKIEDFTPLQEHQEQTPSTFFGAKPVLYAHYTNVTLSAPPGQLQQDAVFAKFSTEQDGEALLAKNVDIYVNSEYENMAYPVLTTYQQRIGASLSSKLCPLPLGSQFPIPPSHSMRP